MNLLIRIIVLSLVIIISDIYFYRLFKNIFFKSSKRIKLLKNIIIALALLFVAFEICWYIIIGFPLDDFIKYRELFALLDVFILVYLPKAFSAFFLIIFDLFNFISIKCKQARNKEIVRKKNSWAYITALVIMIAILSFCVYGFVYGKTDLKLHKLELEYRDLPESFDGFKIVQITDIHLGSFSNTKAIEKYCKAISDIAPDMLVMTGDLINVSDKELEPYYPFLGKIDPPYGKYSILGNHDIGDYFKMKDPPNHAEITSKLIAGEKNMGFIMLVDSALYIKKGEDSIALIGVNNCGTFPFKHNGNLKKALSYANAPGFKILLSHDPNHWSMEVTSKTDISLTLSGHTHAMQLAIITKLFSFSPSMLVYKNWYGLYRTGEQDLYVNPGLGFSGFSGRIGTRPEITLFTLHRSK